MGGALGRRRRSSRPLGVGLPGEGRFSALATVAACWWSALMLQGIPDRPGGARCSLVGLKGFCFSGFSSGRIGPAVSTRRPVLATTVVSCPGGTGVPRAVSLGRGNVDRWPYPEKVLDWVRQHLTSSEALSTLIATVALLISLITLRRQNVQWREGGPAASCAIYPGAMYEGGQFTGVPSAVVANALRPTDTVSPVVVLRVSGTGRLPIYVSSARFETMHVFRGRNWRWWKPWSWRDRHRLTWFGMPVSGGDLCQQIDVAQRRDFAFAWGPIRSIADEAHHRRGPSTVRAVVVLGNGTVVQTKPMNMLSPPEGSMSHLTCDDQPVPTEP